MIEEGRELLAQWHRYELRDRYFGDSEIEWLDDEGVCRASGYLGRTDALVIYNFHSYESDEVIKLAYICKSNHLEYNE